ncbi:MAG: succinate dehydrogenase / fumarate reductase, iron-sulfur subunit, partial [Candidatus Eremiobacteraeota bacterium]|nr:succinate dehydrogenase / fumarate reductase, iron-sulfur subunit [Candidatus Eremiobacteraeota bacterium]
HDDIIAVKRATIEEGITNAAGPRHALVVAKTIKATGMLHETEVIQGTVGRFNIVGLIKVAPFGIRLALAGKIPPLFLKPVPKVDEIRTIFETLEAPTL